MGRQEQDQDSETVTPGSFNHSPLEIVAVEIFADGYFLGESLVGNPLSLICQRSPDGSRLAFLEQPETPPFASGRLRWLDLTSATNQEFGSNELLPEGSTYGRDIAFSPEGRFLAFWGCPAGRDCGVYLVDLGNGSSRLFWSTDYASSFQWSPDGKDLAFVRWFHGELLVVNIDEMNIRHKENVRQEDREALRAEEFFWLSQPAVAAAGLASCGLSPNLP
jgi:dipeptidyl aminopeptidase/acylaminoacyl peptidase